MEQQKEVKQDNSNWLDPRECFMDGFDKGFRFGFEKGNKIVFELMDKFIFNKSEEDKSVIPEDKEIADALYGEDVKMNSQECKCTSEVSPAGTHPDTSNSIKELMDEDYASTKESGK